MPNSRREVSSLRLEIGKPLDTHHSDSQQSGSTEIVPCHMKQPGIRKGGADNYAAA